MKVLVTGGAGFIGSHVCRLLWERGDEVTVIDDLSSGHQELLNPKVRFIKGSILDNGKLDEALNGQDAVIHMAAFIIVPESVEKPMTYVQNNVIGTASLLEGMRRHGVGKVVFSSSATVYGNPQRLPLKESDPLGVPENTYGATKVCMEMLAQSYHRMFGLDTVILRYFNPYGPNEKHHPETHAIPNLIKSALKKEPIPLYWKGEQVRDFIYVEDLAEAHLSVLAVEGMEVFNIGTEKGTKVKEVLTEIFNILGYKVPINDLGDRKGDVMANYASSQKLTQMTGWKPKTSLADGLKKTVSFYQQENE